MSGFSWQGLATVCAYLVDEVPVLVGHALERFVAQDARVVDEDINAAKRLDGRVNDLVTIVNRVVVCDLCRVEINLRNTKEKSWFQHTALPPRAMISWTTLSAAADDEPPPAIAPPRSLTVFGLVFLQINQQRKQAARKSHAPTTEAPFEARSRAYVRPRPGSGGGGKKKKVNHGFPPRTEKKKSTQVFLRPSKKKN